MTRKEAIKIFNTVLFFGKCDCPKEEIEECLKMAIKALEQKPYEKFKSTKDHIYKLASDYKCWDNRLTQDEALELCHILEQESILDRDCEHCSKTYGTLGCCDTVSNEWVYSCKEGQREYLLDKIRAEIKALSPEPTAYDVIDGNPIKDAVWETIADVLQIIDKYKDVPETNVGKMVESEVNIINER